MAGWLKNMFSKEVDVSIGTRASNDQVRANLMSHGDDGTQPRAVEHFGFPNPAHDNAQPEDVVRAEIEALGYAHRVLVAQDSGAEWHEFNNVSEVASGDFDAVTADFVKRLEANGWIYDGWSCSVLQPTTELRKN